MVTTIDGRAALGGSTRSLGGDADLEMLVALRSWAQALVVGSGTVAAEGYGRIREGLLVVVVSRSGDFPREAPLFAAEGQPVETTTVDPAEVVASLRERGMGRILCEGGPTLLRAWLEAELVDDLFLTVHPVIAGGDELRIVEGERFETPRRASLEWAIEERGELFLRYGLRPRG